MATEPSREQQIKKAQRLATIQRFASNIQGFFYRFKRSVGRQELMIETEFGTVRVLGYGLDNPKTTPILFDLHGGGFILGSADMDEAMNVQFQQQLGCKVISIDYAKAPKYPYPMAVNQVYAVVKYFYANAERYAIDRTKMAIGGHSAGGNLSAVTCLKAKHAGQFQFVCQVLDYPPLDLATSPFAKPNPKGAIPPQMAAMFDASYREEHQAKDPYVSPVYAELADLVGLPPALFILAGRDSLHDEGLRYEALLKQAGVATECYSYPEAPHGFTYKASADTSAALANMVAFLQKYLQA
ncbi:alpha/beta hydrolase [Herpetosiphon giganteus]|uniref:alpha/beta hydrolase n=1 Tax=Herpetosiphon giganteus TaxID=2029754 RepID=UPI0019582DD7|nr:alpha/beta hydrolase [Herpetosiphon giganteus]MBM7845738.1 acetyl esterase [Herpetosiphon giganteus]